jgi:hypothetical protein
VSAVVVTSILLARPIVSRASPQKRRFLVSYDLAVFDPDAAPQSRVEFLTWFDEQTQWGESHGYNDPGIPVPALGNWFREMIIAFPPMNGPLRSSDPGDPRVTDYSLGRNIIYGAFAGSMGVDAYQRAFELAQKHRVGFYNLSDEPSDIWIPGAGGTLTKVI